MQMWGKIHVLDTLAAWVIMRQMLRLLRIGMWICSSLMAALWTGNRWETVSKIYNYWNMEILHEMSS